ncbi:hypothetical protein Dacet_1131 [Denitrovibrio acetiphilus DSM 12809]|uniref:Nif11 domain-containing protein n=1 Tax=Denitrovibrio acetiphilus (strain DSM 12809 / NBRC 114555 / N2460) TaxID=522772 RepID=D4H7A4_DENA2|nr:hypothetical protein [Denitrovibrio acetiphilus]ADD67903.1 hypothetical protein Dacet_1131 [Denitrovibrio acetiphilus DSM 12809]
MQLIDVLKQIDSDDAMKQKFLENPKEVLTTKGLDVDKLDISTINKANRGLVETTELRLTVCGSLGAGGGVSVGGEV